MSAKEISIPHATHHVPMTTMAAGHRHSSSCMLQISSREGGARNALMPARRSKRKQSLNSLGPIPRWHARVYILIASSTTSLGASPSDRRCSWRALEKYCSTARYPPFPQRCGHAVHEIYCQGKGLEPPVSHCEVHPRAPQGATSPPCGPCVAQVVEALERSLATLLRSKTCVCCRPLSPCCESKGGVVGP